MKSAAFSYARAATVAQACDWLAHGAGMAKVLGGGQSLGPMMNLRLAQPDALIDVRALAHLQQCTQDAAAITLGASITHAAIEDGRVPDPAGGMMRYVAAGIAYRAIRNRGTLGGSLAHADPAADWVNLMPLLQAHLLLQGPAGARSVAAVDWMSAAFTTALHDDEILTAVRIPRLGPGARWSYYKVQRKAGEFADALAAFIDDPRRGVRRGLIGATDSRPHVFDAGALLDTGNDALADRELCAAGLKPRTHEYRIHAVALARAAAGLVPISEGTQ